jgi:hypothetical protein
MALSTDFPAPASKETRMEQRSQELKLARARERNEKAAFVAEPAGEIEVRRLSQSLARELLGDAFYDRGE